MRPACSNERDARSTLCGDLVDPAAAEDFAVLVKDGGLAGGEGKLGLVEDDSGAFPIVGNADGSGGAVAAVARAHFAVKFGERNAKLDSNKDSRGFPNYIFRHITEGMIENTQDPPDQS